MFDRSCAADIFGTFLSLNFFRAPPNLPWGCPHTPEVNDSTAPTEHASSPMPSLKEHPHRLGLDPLQPVGAPNLAEASLADNKEFYLPPRPQKAIVWSLWPTLNT